MSRKLPIALMFILLLAAALACGQSVKPPTPDPNAASTAIVETFNALQAQFTPTLIPTESTPTMDASTVTPDTSLTSSQGTDAANLPDVYVTVSVATFCRLGPGKEYDKAGILLVGQVAEVIGRDAFGQFWYIRNPDIGPEYCWISAEYATVEGNVLSLFAQPPPSNLTSDVDFTYDSLGKCRDRWWVNILIQNRSSSTFKSISLIVLDGVTNVSRSFTFTGFPFTDRCAAQTSVGTLAPDKKVSVSSPEYTYNIVGDEMHVSLTLCTDVELRGTCVGDKLTFTP